MRQNGDQIGCISGTIMCHISAYSVYTGTLLAPLVDGWDVLWLGDGALSSSICLTGILHAIR